MNASNLADASRRRLGDWRHFLSADTVPVGALALVPAMVFFGAGAVWGTCDVIWKIRTGNTTNGTPDIVFPEWLSFFLFKVEPCLFLIGSLAIATNMVSGIRRRRLTVGQVSQSRFICFLLLLMCGFGVEGRYHLWFPAVGCAVCVVVMFAVRARGRTVAVDPLTGRAARSSGAVGLPVFPDRIEVGGQMVPVAWHVPDGQSVRDGDGTAAAWAVLGDVDGVPEGGLLAGARIAYDSAQWFKAPFHADEVDPWLRSTLGVLNGRYGFGDNDADSHVLLRMLSRFVTADAGSPNLFIHFFDDVHMAPLPVVCPITVDLTGGGAGQAMGAQLAADNPGGGTTVDAGTGLVRYDSYSSDASGQLLAVRYHRQVPSLHTDIVLSCEGIPMREVPTMLPKLDALAGSITVSDHEGHDR